jgi:hypothetical protein
MVVCSLYRKIERDPFDYMMYNIWKYVSLFRRETSNQILLERITPKVVI